MDSQERMERTETTEQWARMEDADSATTARLPEPLPAIRCSTLLSQSTILLSIKAYKDLSRIWITFFKNVRARFIDQVFDTMLKEGPIK